MTPALKAEHIAVILDRAAHGQATADEIALALRWVEDVKAALMEQWF